LRFDVPNLQPQTADDLGRVEGRGLRRLQLRYFGEDLRQSVERDTGIQVMDVMIADIGGEPGPEWTSFYVAGGFHRGFLVRPARIIAKRNAGKIVLRIKQIGSNGAGDEVRDDLREQQRRPAKDPGQHDRDPDMYHERDEAVIVFPWISDERGNTHPVKEYDWISEQDGQRMAHKQVGKARGLR